MKLFPYHPTRKAKKRIFLPLEYFKGFVEGLNENTRFYEKWSIFKSIRICTAYRIARRLSEAQTKAFGLDWDKGPARDLRYREDWAFKGLQQLEADTGIARDLSPKER